MVGAFSKTLPLGLESATELSGHDSGGRKLTIICTDSGNRLLGDGSSIGGYHGNIFGVGVVAEGRINAVENHRVVRVLHGVAPSASAASSLEVLQQLQEAVIKHTRSGVSILEVPSLSVAVKVSSQ